MGASIVIGHFAAALVIAGALAVLLHSKRPLHNFARAMGERDMRAMMQFVLLSLVILPVLPNQDFGPYAVWNPFKLWLMVVLIVGISLGGYIAYKLFGARAGAVLGGVIGGLVSSTATTVSYARRTGSDATLASLSAFVIVTASCISVVRVLIEIAAVAPSRFAAMAWPFVAMLLVCALLALGFYFPGRKHAAKIPEQKNPAELKPALLFGALYAFVLLAVAAAKQYFGSAGLYIVAIISGLTDLDAITLSTGQLADSDKIEADIAWRVILVALLSNLRLQVWHRSRTWSREPDKAGRSGHGGRGRRRAGHSPVMARRRGQTSRLNATTEVCLIRFGDQAENTVVVAIKTLQNDSRGTSFGSDFSGTFSVLAAPPS